jgi:serine/threonine protein kinase
MVDRSHSCDPSRLRSLLNDRLPEDEQAELAEHLEQCPSCRRALEGLAAARPWWTDLRRLAGADEPLMNPTRPPIDLAEQEQANEREKEYRIEAQVYPPKLPFLAPSEYPEHLGRLGPYEVTELIGQGGMGIVLKAHDSALHRVVAIKMLAPELATSAAARRRFAREAQAAAAVAHEHVVLIHAVDSAQGLPYLVMAYVPGKSLHERIERNGPLELKEILRIGRQAAAGLAAAHAQGLVHRDVKPANILLENGVERVKLTDFGLARAVDDASLTQSGVVTGTPQYMAPEQARGEAVDHRADLFSLGSVLYAMCTGRSPFRAETTMAVLRRVSEEPARPVREINPEIPPWLAAIIARLHAKDPSERYQSAAEVAEILGQWLAYVQQPNQIPPPFPLEEEPPASPPQWVRPKAIAAATLLVLGVGLGATEATGLTRFVGLVPGILGIGEPLSPAPRPVPAPGRAPNAESNPAPASFDRESEAELHLLREKNRKLEANQARKAPVNEAELVRVREKTRKAWSFLEAARRVAQPEETVRRNLDRIHECDDELDRLETRAEEAEETQYGEALLQAKSALKTANKLAHILNDPEVLKYQARVDQVEEAESTRLRASLRQAQDRLIRARELGLAQDDPTVVRYQKKVEQLEAKLARREPAEPAEGAPPAQLRKALREFQDRLLRAQRLARTENDPTVLRYQEQVQRLEARLAEHEPTIEEPTAPGAPVPSSQPQPFAPMSSLAVVAAATLNPVSPVWCVAFAPDARRVAAATGSSDRAGRLWVWELQPGPPLRFERTLKISAPVRSLVFSPDGKTLACVEFRVRDQVIQGNGPDALRPELTLRNPETGAVRTRLEGHAKAVVAVVFTPDGQRLVTASLDRTVKIWDLKTGQVKRTLSGHDDGVLALAIASDGRTLASGSLDRTVRIWDLETGTEQRVLRGHTSGVESLAFAPDGKTLISAGPDQAVRIWEVATGRPRATLLVEGDSKGTLSLAYGPDGQTIAAGASDGTLMIWGVTPDDGMPLLKRFRAHDRGINSLVYSPDGAYLATGGVDDSVKLWDARPAALFPALPVPAAPIPGLPPAPTSRQTVP